MVTIKTTFISGKVEVTIEEPVSMSLGAAIRMINSVDINEVTHKAPEIVCYPDTIKFVVTDGVKQYIRKIEGVMYASVVSFKERNSEALEHFWDKL